MRIACITLTPLALDARVQRTVQALEEVGHEILVVAQAPFPAEGFVNRCVLAQRRSAVAQRLILVAREAPATMVPQLADRLYWISTARRNALRAVMRFRPDVVICNDAITLPIGTLVKRRIGARLVYDSHEFAVREHIQNWKWRLVSRASIARIERRTIKAADLVMTVSAGIADALRDLYALPVRPTVVRNLPVFQPSPARPSGTPLTILFHGLIRHERGLEQLVDSMPLWSFDGRLIIRGYGVAAYLDRLAARCRERGVADKVVFEPSVPPSVLIEKASEADIGYLALPETTDQYRFALPNKLFEYVMAGLAVVATPRNEIARFVTQTGVGVVSELDPEALARTLNSLRRDDLAVMRSTARTIAPDYSWEVESKVLVRAVQKVRE